MSLSNQPPGKYRGAGRRAACALALVWVLPVAAHAQEQPCPASPAVTPLLYAGGKAGARPATLRYSAALARAGLVATGPVFDGPAQLQALADPWATATAGPGGEPASVLPPQRRGQEDGVLGVGSGAGFIHVALPERREGAQVRYAVWRFTLVPGALHYRVVLASPPRSETCGPSAQAGVQPANPAAAASLAFKGVTLRRVPPLDLSSFSMPQTSVQLTVGRRQPDLYQAATDALASAGFSQGSREAAESRPGELVLGSAAGLHSGADFDVRMRLAGNGVLDVAVLSTRQPLEINEERARARELSDRVLSAFAMLAPPGPRAISPAKMQEQKP